MHGRAASPDDRKAMAVYNASLVPPKSNESKTSLRQLGVVMDLRLLGLCFAAFVLAATALVYGFKFCREAKLSARIEWWVIAFSASNFLF